MDLLREWEGAKTALSDGLGLSRDMLHVHGGLALFMALILLLRRPRGSVLPLLLVLGVEIANEAMDFARYHLSGWPWRPGPTLRDVFDTLLWPTLLTLAARRPDPKAFPGPAAAVPRPPPSAADDRSDGGRARRDPLGPDPASAARTPPPPPPGVRPGTQAIGPGDPPPAPTNGSAPR